MVQSKYKSACAHLIWKMFRIQLPNLFYLGIFLAIDNFSVLEYFWRKRISEYLWFLLTDHENTATICYRSSLQSAYLIKTILHFSYFDQKSCNPKTLQNITKLWSVLMFDKGIMAVPSEIPLLCLCFLCDNIIDNTVCIFVCILCVAMLTIQKYNVYWCKTKVHQQTHLCLCLCDNVDCVIKCVTNTNTEIQRVLM